MSYIRKLWICEFLWKSESESRCSSEGVKVERVRRESVGEFWKLYFVVELQLGIRFCLSAPAAGEEKIWLSEYFCNFVGVVLVGSCEGGAYFLNFYFYQLKFYIFFNSCNFDGGLKCKKENKHSNQYLMKLF